MHIFNVQRAITLKVRKRELRFVCSNSYCLMVLNICVRFYENISNGFQSYGGDMILLQTDRQTPMSKQFVSHPFRERHELWEHEIEHNSKCNCVFI